MAEQASYPRYLLFASLFTRRLINQSGLFLALSTKIVPSSPGFYRQDGLIGGELGRDLTLSG